MRMGKPEYLVVDEDDGTRRYLATTLHRSGCRVTTAADPIEGMVYASVGNFDVIVCHGMAEADVRRLGRQGASARLIVVTDEPESPPHAAGEVPRLPLRRACS